MSIAVRKAAILPDFPPFRGGGSKGRKEKLKLGQPRQKTVNHFDMASPSQTVDVRVQKKEKMLLIKEDFLPMKYFSYCLHLTVNELKQE